MSASRHLFHRIRSHLQHYNHKSITHFPSLSRENPLPRRYFCSQFSRKNPLSSPFSFSTRFLSTSTATRRRPKVDIGARARQLQTRRLWTYALTFSCVAGFIVIVLNQFQDQLVFYVTPTDCLEKFRQDPNKKKSYRLGGLVLEGSVVNPSKDSAEMEFVVSDLMTDMLVRHKGELPDLFREGHSVVVEGFVRPFSEEIRNRPGAREVSKKARELDYYFAATMVLAKHDEKYMPPEVAAALEKNKKKLEEEAEAKQAAVLRAQGS